MPGLPQQERSPDLGPIAAFVLPTWIAVPVMIADLLLIPTAVTAYDKVKAAALLPPENGSVHVTPDAVEKMGPGVLDTRYTASIPRGLVSVLAAFADGRLDRRLSPPSVRASPDSS